MAAKRGPALYLAPGTEPDEAMKAWLSYLAAQIAWHAGLEEETPGQKWVRFMDEEKKGLASRKTREGIKKAKENGQVWGRPKVGKDVEIEIMQRRLCGIGMAKIARELGIGTSVVQRVVRESER